METFIVIWILLLFAAAFALRLSFGNRKQKSVLAKLRNIDPEMSLLEEGAYVGGALGISQAKYWDKYSILFCFMEREMATHSSILAW